MAARARAFAEEDFFSGLRISGDFLWCDGSVKAPDVAYQLPDFVRKHVEPGHLAARNAFANVLKNLRILAAMQEFAGRQRWAAPAARITAMADLAGLLK